MTDFFTWLVLVKIVTAVLMVVALSVLAEVVSPRFAGIVSGYPLGAAISLFFMGFDFGPQFAAASARYTSLGLIATQVFAYSYYRTSLLTDGMRRGLGVLLSSIGGTIGFFAAAMVLRFFPANTSVAVLLPVAFIVYFTRLFRSVKNTKIEKRAGMDLKAMLLRSAFAAGVIVAATSIAGTVGTGWAGLFAAFPMTMLPSTAIIHFTYEPEHVRAFLKNVPKGLGCLVVYALAVSLTYPAYGIYLGTIFSYAAATVFLGVIQVDWFALGKPVRLPAASEQTGGRRRS